LLNPSTKLKMRKRVSPARLVVRCFALASLSAMSYVPASAQDLALNAKSGPPASLPVDVATPTSQKNMSLESFVKQFQQDFGVFFSYAADDLKGIRVSYETPADKRGADPDKILKAVLTPAGLEFQKIQHAYVIRIAPVQKEPDHRETTVAATMVVKGKVMDASGPLAGVTILERGSATVAATDAGGNFLINVSAANAILVFTHVGYTTIDVPVNGRSFISVTMEAGKAQDLSGVVVTALGLSRQKKSLGYSVGEISGEDMNRVNQSNVLNSMAGKVSGVTISSTGASPTSSVSMVIRGVRSLNGDNQPLFVVDGVPVKNSLNNIGTNNGNGNDVDYGNAIADLNAADIESVSILKGPSAAALYGSRAGNGVVLITTKAGRKTKGLGVSFNSSTEFAKPYNYFPLNLDYTVGSDPYTTPNGFNSLNGVIVDLAGTDTYRFGTPLNQGIKAIQWNSPMDANGNYVPQDMVSHNNLKNFVRTGISTINNLSIENSTDRDNYRFSFTNTISDGIVPTTSLSKNNLSLNVDHKVSSVFRLSSSINYARSASDNVVGGNRGGVLYDAAYLSPSVDIRQMKNYWLTPNIQQRKALPPVGVDQDPSVPDMLNDGMNNPWFTLNQVKNGFVRNHLYGNLKADLTFNSHWKAFIRYSQDLAYENRETKIAKSYQNEKRGFYNLTNIFNSENNTDFLVSYHTRFLRDFDLTTSGGGNLQFVHSSNEQAYSAPGTGIIAPGLFNLSNIAQANLRVGSAYYEKAVYSAYALASLGYRDMAYLDLTGRNDWSSTLPAANNSYFYPSASLSLLLNKMINFGPQVSLVKIRGGWASVGKDTDPYNLYGTLNLGSFGGIPTESISNVLKNPGLKPEQAVSTELGMDLGFFKNRLRFEGTVYRSDNKNQILSINTPSSSGFSSRQINAGLIRSEGIELQLSGTIVATRDWTWNMSVNYTKNNAYILSLTSGVPYFSFWQDGNSGSWTYAKGQPIPNAFKADGSPVISDGKLGQLWDNQVATVTDKKSPYYGYPLLDDGGFYQKVSGGDFNHKEVVGNYNPKLLMGFQTSVSYKMLTLTASVDMRMGGTFFSQTYRYMQSDAATRRQENMGIKIPAQYAGNIAGYLKSNPDKFIKFSGLQQFHLVGGPTTATGGFAYTDNGNVTINDGAFYPGVYSDGNGGYVENLGDMNVTKLDNYEDAVTASWPFARMSMFDASYIKIRELTLSAALPQRWASSLKLQGITLGLYTRNIILWTKAKAGIDPELAYQFQQGAQGNNSQFRQGIEQFNITPWTIPMGVKLGVRF
jgi:TonB-linked SusC/RagA family outer membrane protein